MRALTLAIALGLPALLAACAGSFGPDSDMDILNQARGPEEQRKLHTDLIRKMIQDNKLYAALAHIEAQKKTFGETPKLKLLRAEVLRKLGRTMEAERLYRQLLAKGEYRGYANHGMGLILVPTHLGMGLKYLQMAVTLLPTDAHIRNDLGYALLEQGMVNRAKLNLATAYQLDAKGKLARNNYIVCLLVAGDKRKAAEVASEGKLERTTMKRLRKQAQAMQDKIRHTPAATAASAVMAGVGGGGG